MTQNELKKCDWLCYFKNEFYFIEAKDVKMKKRNEERKDAVEKFDATIPYFQKLYPATNIVIIEGKSHFLLNS